MSVVFFGLFICIATVLSGPVRIERTRNGEPIFVLENNNQTYLRGSNYIRLINASRHVLFEPDMYSRWDVEGALEQMHSYGYNYVRVFLSCPSFFDGFGLKTPGIPMSYTQNVVDFLVKAAKYNITVMVTGEWSPANYQSIINSYPLPPNVTGTNLLIFHEGQVAARAQMYKDLLNEIKNASLLAFNNIFAIDIFNEISVSVHLEPFSLTSGLVSFDGQSFDMSKGDERQRLVDFAGNLWFNTVASAIKSVAPSILVSSSLFSPNAVGHDGFDGVQTRPPNADARYPLRPGSLVDSMADYIDLHVYASRNNSRAEFNGAGLSLAKPLLLGETGTFKFNAPDPLTGALSVKTVMIQSVDYHFTGWGIWTWDAVEQLVLWTLTEANNTMNNVLSPKVWPYVTPSTTLID